MRQSHSIGVVAVMLVGAVGTVPGAFAQSPAPMIPNTPAGRTLVAYLDALNSGDRAQMAAYCARYQPDCSGEELLAFFKQTGGLHLVGVSKSEPLYIECVLKNRAGPITGFGRLHVTEEDPARVTSFKLRVIPPGMTAADMNISLDATSRSRVIDGVVAKLNEYYVYPDLAKKMEQALRTHQKKGAYEGIIDGDTLATSLTQYLQDISHDKHLHVEFVPNVLPKVDPKPDQPMDAQMRARIEQDNCGFEKVERLESNIGYLKFNFFGPPSVCGPTATAAINFLAHVDAIIFDLRENGGGNPEMVAFLASYLFNERTRLNDIYERKENKTTEYWTQADVPGTKLAGKPAFVLTSKRTFSAAEDFTYALKNLKRATIIGETTGGGAHPTRGLRVDDHFIVGVPFARSISSITKTDWEGTGVEPNVKVPADQALEVARKLAAETVRNAAPHQEP